MTPAEKEEVKKNITWDRNHAVIRQAYAELVKESAEAKDLRQPTITEIAERVRLTWKTVKAHISEIRTEVTGHSSSILFDEVLLSVALKARGGSYHHAKLYFEVLGHLNQAKDGPIGGAVPQVGTINIQVNKTYVSADPTSPEIGGHSTEPQTN